MGKIISGKKVATIFVEGKSDKIILEKCFDVFDVKMKNKIHLEDGGLNYGSANAVTSRSIAWLLEMRHIPTNQRTPSIAIFDGDEAGKNAKEELKKALVALNLSSTQYFKQISLSNYKTNNHIKLISTGIIFSIDLESLYSIDFLKLSRRKGWMDKLTDYTNILNKNTINAVISGRQNPTTHLDEDSKLISIYKFKEESKIKAANFIKNLETDKAKKVLTNFEKLIRDINQHIETIGNFTLN